MGNRHRHTRGSGKRGPASQQMVDRGAERVEIAARVDRAPLGLLRAHVERCAQGRAVLGEIEASCAVEQSRQSKVGYLHLAGRGNEQIFRLDVAVHDPLLGRPHQRRANLRQHSQGLLGRERPPLGQPEFQRWTGDIFLSQKMNAVDAGHFVNLHDVAMHQGRSRPGLLRKALHGGGMEERFSPQHLHRHLPGERFLLGEIDISHRPTAQPAHHPVAPQLPPGEIGIGNGG